MEEWVGHLWHRAITRAARREYPQAAVRLDEIRRPAAVLFRALGGDGGLRIETANETASTARRKLLDRIAGTGKQVSLAWRDKDTLRLPASIAWYAERDLNRQLYLWLAALATRVEHGSGDWLQQNAAAAAELLTAHPGLARRYRTLVEQHLQQRPDIHALKADEALQEQMIRQALLDPAAVSGPLVAARVAPQPVPLWLHPQPPNQQPAQPAAGDDDEDDETDEQHSKQVDTDKRRRGERVEAPDGRDGLLAFRLESLFTRAEYVAVDRTTEENEDEDAQSALEDMDVVSVITTISTLARDCPCRSGTTASSCCSPITAVCSPCRHVMPGPVEFPRTCRSRRAVCAVCLRRSSRAGTG